MSQTFVSPEQIELQKLQVQLAQTLSDLSVTDFKVDMMRDFFGSTMYKFRGYVLADHIEHKEVEYEVIEFPKWLKWLKRYCKVDQRVANLEAYHTYPKASVKLPELGKNYVTTFTSDFSVTELTKDI